jgi:hypothetical protein
MEKKSLVSKKNVPASKTDSRRVDLSKPAPVRVELCKASGEKRGKYM